MNSDERAAAPADFKVARRQKAALTTSPNADRLPPHSIEAEQGVLGCVLLSPGDCLDRCIEKLAGPAAFYDLRHRITYETLLGMRESKVPIDTITVQQALRDRQELEAVGGLAYLASLPDAVPSAANLDYYLTIVREKYLLRELVKTCTAAAASAYEQPGRIAGILASFEEGASRIRQLSGDDGGAMSNREVMAALVDQWEAAANGTLPAGIRTGFVDFDVWTGGLKAAQLFIIAARPSKGKSSLALNIADHVAVTLGAPVAFFSLEMSRKELLERAACARARVDNDRLKRGIANEREIRAITGAQSPIVKAPLHIVDKGGLSIARLSGLARTITQRHGIKLVIVDHLGLVGCGECGRTRYEEITKVSGALKALAMDLQVPVIALAQLNRACESEEREPRMSDLRDSGSIEQDADIVALLHPNAEDIDDTQRTKLIVAKHRGGRTGIINLVFHKAWTRFDSATRET